MSGNHFENNDLSTANGVFCQYCGSTPAVRVDFRAHRGLLFVMHFRTLPGPFCRWCGLAVFRHMTGDSLVQGWWSPVSFFINPITVLLNVAVRSQVAALPPPLPGARARPMPPGKPLTRRWQMAGLIVPLAIASLIAATAGGADWSTSHKGHTTYTLYP